MKFNIDLDEGKMLSFRVQSAIFFPNLLDIFRDFFLLCYILSKAHVGAVLFIISACKSQPLNPRGKPTTWDHFEFF